MFEFLAVDLGATSGRVAIGQVGSDSISLDIVHRFLHEVIPQEDGSLLWNWDLILTEVLTGLKEAIKKSDPISLAVDSWAVDYGFISPTGQYLPPVHAYRDPRNEIAYQELTKRIGKERIYSTTGIQFLPFHTIYQLYASRSLPEYKKASNFLMLPDLVNFLLTQKISTEVTNASSTQVLNTRTRDWDRDLITLAGIREDLFTDLHEPGSLIGVVHGFDVLDGINVVATASHDTAAAIAGIPFNNRETEAYISSGTWSLVGVELDEPVLTPEAFAANITNELGVDGTVRALKNVTGMWILEECRRTWLLEGRKYGMPKVLELAFASRTFATLIDPNEPDFAHPGGMPERIYAYCIERGLTPPQSDGELAFCILNSLAHAYKKSIDEISVVTGRTIELIHILGGGSQIDLLNQLTADVCRVTVKTGPVEATLFGNIAVQAIAAGVVTDLKAARSLIRNSFTSKEFRPSN
jgi:rhamnulokinase